MAKLTANGATEVARWRLSIEDADLGTLALTSDGRILRKGTVQGDGWKVAAKVHAGASTNGSRAEKVERFYARRGYRLERIRAGR